MGLCYVNPLQGSSIPAGAWEARKRWPVRPGAWEEKGLLRIRAALCGIGELFRQGRMESVPSVESFATSVASFAAGGILWARFIMVMGKRR